MIASGFVRKIDELGRIVIPSEIRKALYIKEKDALEIFIDGQKLILQKYQPGDLFTGQLDDLIEYKGKRFSKATIKELANLASLDVSNE